MIDLLDALASHLIWWFAMMAPLAILYAICGYFERRFTRKDRERCLASMRNRAAIGRTIIANREKKQ